MRRSAMWVFVLLATAACERLPTEPRPAPDSYAAALGSAVTRTGGSPPATTVVCVGQARPKGYYVVAVRYSASCPSNAPSSYNAYLLAWAVGKPMAICSFDGIPNRWVVTSTSYGGQCPGNGGTNPWPNVYVAAPLPAAGKTLSMCSFSFLPLGWVVTSVARGGQCPSSGGSSPAANVYVVALLAGQQMTFCSFSQIPLGWTVVGRGNSWSCPDPQWTNTVTVRRA
jgi:hypothetical protein